MKKYLTVILLALVWSLYYVAVGIVNKVIPPLLTGSIIRVVVFILLGAVMIRKKTICTLLCTKKAVPFLILIGIMGFLLDITAFMGLQYSSAGTGTVLLKSDILFVCLISAILYKEKVDWPLVLLMLIGVMMVMNFNPFHLQLEWSDLFFILSALCVTINAFLIKHVQTKMDKPVSNEVIAFYNNGVAMLLFLLILPVMGGGNSFHLVIQDVKLLLVALIASLGQFFIYVFYYKSLRQLPVWIVKTILLLIPVFALIADVILWHQIPNFFKLIGTAIVLLSAALILWKQHKKQRANVN